MKNIVLNQKELKQIIENVIEKMLVENRQIKYPQEIFNKLYKLYQEKELEIINNLEEIMCKYFCRQKDINCNSNYKKILRRNFEHDVIDNCRAIVRYYFYKILDDEIINYINQIIYYEIERNEKEGYYYYKKNPNEQVLFSILLNKLKSEF